jgi:DNA adenine methylase
MKYMGSKNRIAKHILPIILKDRKEGQCYVETMVGGANLIDKVDGWRIGADINKPLIDALTLIRDDAESIPVLISEDDYAKAKESREGGLNGFIGFAMSFGGKWFGGYRRDVKGTKGRIENMKTQTRRSRNNAIAQGKNLIDVVFSCCGYGSLDIPPQSIIYCDPPYAGTTKYKDDFDHGIFFEWCREKCKEGHQVFISEYNAPYDFVCVWQKELQSGLNTNSTKKGVEKLFVHESQCTTEQLMDYYS